MKHLSLILFFILSFSCQTDNDCKEFVETKEKTSTNYIKNTTNSKSDLFYILENSSDSMYQIIWGVKDSIEFTSQSIFFNPQSGRNLDYCQSNENTIVLEESCGMTCKKCIILSLKNKSEVFYFDPLSYDLDQNLIAYFNQESNNEIIVENYNTKKSITIRLEKTCSAINSKDCIVKCFFLKNEFYYVWEGDNWTINNSDLRIEKISINSIL